MLITGVAHRGKSYSVLESQPLPNYFSFQLLFLPYTSPRMRMQGCWSLDILITMIRISKRWFILLCPKQTFSTFKLLKEINVTIINWIVSPSHAIIINSHVYSLYEYLCVSGPSSVCRSKINNIKITTTEVPLISSKW